MSFDDPNWASLQAAYGPAKDVPALLHRLNSPSHAERSTAITDLWGCLCHQGTVYEASAVAAPLLLDAAQRPNLSSEDRTQLLALLVHIGLGADTTWQGYTSWTVVEDCARAVEALLPRLAELALEGMTEARAWTLALAAYHPNVWVALGVDADQFMALGDTGTAVLVRCAVSGTTPEPSVIATVLEENDELRDYFEEVISELPRSGHARGLVLELADEGRL